MSAEALPSSRPPPWNAVRYPPEPLAALRDDTARWQGNGISTAARVMVHHLVASDGVRIALLLTRDAADEPAEDPTRHWLDDAFDGLEAVVRMPDGSERKLTTLPAAAGESAADRAALWSPALTILRLDDTGVRSETGPRRAWRETASDVFTTLGPRRIVLRGALDVAGRRIAFQAGELSYQVVDVSTQLPIAELERHAAHELFGPGRAALVLAGPARSDVYVEAMRAVDDAAGNRWLWFVSHLGWASDERTDIHVNVTPSGQLVASDRRRERTCLAEGTRLATVDGPKAIERGRRRSLTPAPAAPRVADRVTKREIVIAGGLGALLLATAGAFVVPDVWCRMRSACAGEGRCTFASSIGTCVAGSDADCRGSQDCRERGACAYLGSACVAASDADCWASLGCTDRGECAQRFGKCVWSDEGCARTSKCKKDGSCSAGPTGCVATDDAHCEPTRGCRELGWCSAVEGLCRIGKDADCDGLSACRDSGRCTAKPPVECIATTVEACRRSTYCRRYGRCSPAGGECVAAVEADCLASDHCAQHGRCAVVDQRCVASDEWGAEVDDAIDDDV